MKDETFAPHPLRVGFDFALPATAAIIEGNRLVRKVTPLREPVTFQSALPDERDFAMRFWQRCPIPSLLNAFWRINADRNSGECALHVLGGPPGVGKTSVASLFADLTNGDNEFENPPLDCTTLQDGAHAFFGATDSGEVNVSYLASALMAGKVGVADEITRAPAPDRIMNIIDQFRRRSSQDVVVRTQVGTIGGRNYEAVFPGSAKAPSMMVIATYNPESGRTPLEYKAIEALSSRMESVLSKIDSLTPDDYAHVISAKLCGLPLTTIQDTLGELPNAATLLTMATYGERPLSKDQMDALANPAAVVEASRVMGDIFYQLQGLLAERMPPSNDPLLGGVLESRTKSPELSDGLDDYRRSSGDYCRADIRFVESIFRYINSPEVTEMGYRARGIPAPTPGLRGMGTMSSIGDGAKPPAILFGERLQSAFLLRSHSMFGAHPSILKAVFDIAPKLTGLFPPHLDGAPAHQKRTVAQILDTPPETPPTLQEQAYQKVFADIVRRMRGSTLCDETIIPHSLIRQHMNEAHSAIDAAVSTLPSTELPLLRGGFINPDRIADIENESLPPVVGLIVRAGIDLTGSSVVAPVLRADLNDTFHGFAAISHTLRAIADMPGSPRSPLWDQMVDQASMLSVQRDPAKDAKPGALADATTHITYPVWSSGSSKPEPDAFVQIQRDGSCTVLTTHAGAKKAAKRSGFKLEQPPADADTLKQLSEGPSLNFDPVLQPAGMPAVLLSDGSFSSVVPTIVTK